MKKKKGYGILKVFTVLITLSAISTLLPQESVSKVCYLGYKAHCTFTPFSTVISLLVAGALCIIRKRGFTEKD
jgi:hypothetical protein